MMRYTVHFSGRVQGVGFRYTAQRAAAKLSVSGFVRNLSDGRVRLVAEGNEGQLVRLVDDVNQAMAGYISEHTVEQSAATGEFDAGQGSSGLLEVRY